ncbi:MAG: GFA family protein [Emcibacteraceae bacterium]|nr:GFA family protein [Emcibacteraceae bacterium]
MITGRCECAKITYQIDGEIFDYSHCHCSQCRRLHGAEYASFGGVKRSEFSYLTGEDHLGHFASSPSHDRVFCKNCGSSIMVALDDEPEGYYVSMGTMDGNPKLPPEYHIFVGSKAPWHTIHGDGAQYETEPVEE